MTAELPTDEEINAMVFEATAAKIKDYCERRVGQGVSNDQLNAELKGYIPTLNAWSRRQRTLIKMMLNDSSAPSQELQ